jgi:hypothetical protein
MALRPKIKILNLILKDFERSDQRKEKRIFISLGFAACYQRDARIFETNFCIIFARKGTQKKLGASRLTKKTTQQ